MTVTLPTAPHDEGIPLDDANWVEGGMSRQSDGSLLVVASPKHAAIVPRHGCLAESVVQPAVDALTPSLDSPTDGWTSGRVDSTVFDST